MDTWEAEILRGVVAFKPVVNPKEGVQLVFTVGNTNSPLLSRVAT
jgi:hypothetical protein